MAQRVTQGVDLAGYRRDDVEVDPPYLHPDYVATRTRAPKRPLVPLPHTLSEITGPAYGHERIGELDHDLTRQHAGEPLGERIILHGRVLDGDGRPVRNTLVEIWQANSAGRYAHAEDVREEVALEEGFDGFGRACTNDDGRYEFLTVKPGRAPGVGGRLQAPHIDVSVFARGLLKRLITRVYFPDEADANEADAVLSSISDPQVRAALVAREEDGGLRFDINLQGDRETTFFAV